MISRAAVAYGGSTFLRIFRVRIPLQWQSILTLGGLQGGMAVALVLSLAANYQFKELFIGLIIPLIAITLVVNPILLKSVPEKLKHYKEFLSSELYGSNANKKRYIIQVPNFDSLYLAFIFYQQINLF
jgi:NhaP-type Na+/H+ or K+/H+ antiporter